MHLLATVFASKSGLGEHDYDLGEITQDSCFAINRMLTGLYSLRNFEWETARIFIDFSKDFKGFRPQVEQLIQEFFPEAKVVSGRIETVEHWRRVSQNYNGEELIFLHSNHDHALIPPDGERSLRELADRMSSCKSLEMGLVTHFPEVIGMVERSRIGSSQDTLKMRTATGTVVVKAKLFQSWWQLSSFPPGTKVTRPDNPFGPSVKFSEISAAVPKHEIMRHLDGYSHVCIQEPVTPLRNTARILEGPTAKIEVTEWSTGYWPTKTAFSDSKRPDLLRTSKQDNSSNLSNQVRIVIARLSIAWAQRPLLLSSARLSDPWDGEIRRLAVVIGVIVALVLPQTVFKMVLKIVDRVAVLAAKKLLRNEKIAASIWANGLCARPTKVARDGKRKNVK